MQLPSRISPGSFLLQSAEEIRLSQLEQQTGAVCPVIGLSGMELDALPPGWTGCTRQESNTSGAKALIRRVVYGPTKVVP